MRTALFAALALLSAPALAQMSPPPMGQGGGSRAIPGVSDQGNAMLQQAMKARDPQLEQVMRQMNTMRDQLNAAANASTIDLDRVSTLIKQREDLQTQYRQLADTRMLNALRQLPPADRPAFMRFLAAPPGGGGRQ